MKIFRILVTHCSLIFMILSATGQQHHERYNSIDILSYRFEIELNDTSDLIGGRAEVEVRFLKELDSFYLDLAGKNAEGKGMLIKEIWEENKKAQYLHQENRIVITIPETENDEVRKYRIHYHGIPADGLIISQNKFGDRTFFGDNWPNRAQHWLPVVDHPSDKARVEFHVRAPGHYDVVANGENINQTRDNGTLSSHWRSSVPLPTKLMVIGVSPFAVQHLESSSGLPVSTWVYPQNKEEGFFDYSIATAPIDFFETFIHPFPFSKLANVQSKTVYGGMENASCIFYKESSVTGKQDHENLIVHEIAHQWFGDALSELNWHHIWLSEGFATYLTDLYLEHKYGRETFLESMLDEKGQVLRFAQRRLAPVVDTTLPVSVSLLNKNTYEKAGWVLHMLRRDLGDELFQKCVRAFYLEYKYGNALTRDFQEIVESLSGKSYDSFFHQWFHEAGHPVLSYRCKFKKNEVQLTVYQHQQQYLFEFPLDIRLSFRNGTSITETLRVSKAKQTFTLHAESRPVRIQLDPDTWLLYED